MNLKTNTILVSLMLLMVGCGQQEKSDAESNKEAVAEAPKMSIHEAALRGDMPAIQQHIAAGSDLNQKDAYGSTPLTVAVTFGKTEAALALMDAGADLNVTNNDGATPLHTAAFLCRTEIVQALLDSGADKTARDKYGSTPLEAVSGPFEQVKPYYEGMAKALMPFGLRLDFERIEQTRPQIAEMLR